MDARFFQWSLPGYKGLILYILGDYAASATAYQAHFAQTAQRYTTPKHSWYALLRRDFDDAERLASKELATTPDAVHSLLTLGEVWVERSNFAQALHFIDLALEEKRDHVDALLLSSISYVGKKEYTQAIELVQRALRSGRPDTRVTTFLRMLKTVGEIRSGSEDEIPWGLLGYYYRYLWRYDPSNASLVIKSSQFGARRKDHAKDSYLNLAIIYHYQGRKEKALQTMLKALENNSNAPEVFRWAAKLHAERGDLIKEYQFRKAAHEAAPFDAFYRDDYYEFLTEKLGDYQQVISWLETLITTNANDAHALYDLGRIHSDVGNYDRSAEYFRKVIQLKPHWYGPYNELAGTLTKMGQLDEARVLYKKAVSLNPKIPQGHAGLAKLYHLEGRFDEAIKEYEEMFRLGDKDPDYLRALCGLYASKSAFDQAVKCYEKVLAWRPNDIRAKGSLRNVKHNRNLQKNE